MTDNFKRFLEAISQDKEFIEKLNKAETPEAIVALAAEKGFTLNAEDLKPEERTGEISDEELEAVAGGKECVCAVGGGGEANDDEDGVCACVLAGYGGGAVPRCTCLAGGYGWTL